MDATFKVASRVVKFRCICRGYSSNPSFHKKKQAVLRPPSSREPKRATVDEKDYKRAHAFARKLDQASLLCLAESNKLGIFLYSSFRALDLETFRKVFWVMQNPREYDFVQYMTLLGETVSSLKESVGPSVLSELNDVWNKAVAFGYEGNPLFLSMLFKTLSFSKKEQRNLILSVIAKPALQSHDLVILLGFLNYCCQNNEPKLAEAIWEWSKRIRNNGYGKELYFLSCFHYLKVTGASADDLISLWRRILECGMDEKEKILFSMLSALDIDLNAKKLFIQHVISKPPPSISGISNLFRQLILHCHETNDRILAKDVWKWGESIRAARDGSKSYFLASFLYYRTVGASFRTFDAIWNEIEEMGRDGNIALVKAMLSAIEIDQEAQRRFILHFMSKDPPSSSLDCSLVCEFLSRCAETNDKELSKRVWKLSESVRSKEYGSTAYFSLCFQYMKIVGATVDELRELGGQIVEYGLDEEGQLVTAMCSALSIDHEEQKRFINQIIQVSPRPSYDCALLFEFLKHCFETGDKALGKAVSNWSKSIKQGEFGTENYFLACFMFLKLQGTCVFTLDAIWRQVVKCGMHDKQKIISAMFSALDFDLDAQKQFISQVITQPPASESYSLLVNDFLKFCSQTKDRDLEKRIREWSESIPNRKGRTFSDFIFRFQQLKKNGASIEQSYALWDQVVECGKSDREGLILSMFSLLALDVNEQKRFISQIIKNRPSRRFSSDLLSAFLKHCLETNDKALVKALWQWSKPIRIGKFGSPSYFSICFQCFNMMSASVKELQSLWRQVKECGLTENCDIVIAMCSALVIDPGEQKRFISQVISNAPNPSFNCALLDEFIKHCSESDAKELAKRIWGWGASIRKQHFGTRHYFSVSFRYLTFIRLPVEKYRSLWKEVVQCRLHRQPDFVNSMFSALATYRSERKQFIVNILKDPPSSSFNCSILCYFMQFCVQTGDRVLGDQVLKWGKRMLENEFKSPHFFLTCFHHHKLMGASVSQLKALWNQIVECGLDGNVDLVTSMFIALENARDERKLFISHIIGNPVVNPASSFNCGLLCRFLKYCVDTGDKELAACVWKWGEETCILKREVGTTTFYFLAWFHYHNLVGFKGVQELKGLWGQIRKCGQSENVELVTSMLTALSIDPSEKKSFITHIITRPASSNLHCGVLCALLSHCAKTDDPELAKSIWEWSKDMRGQEYGTKYYFLATFQYLKLTRATVKELELLWEQVVSCRLGENVGLVNIMCSALEIDAHAQKRFIKQVISTGPHSSSKYDSGLLYQFLKHCSDTNDQELAQALWKWSSSMRMGRRSLSHVCILSHFRYFSIVGANSSCLKELWIKITERGLNHKSDLIRAMYSALASNVEEQKLFISQVISIPPKHACKYDLVLCDFLKHCAETGDKTLGAQVWNWSKLIQIEEEDYVGSCKYILAYLHFLGVTGVANVAELNALWNEITERGLNQTGDYVRAMFSALPASDVNARRRFISQITSSHPPPNETYTCDLLGDFMSHCVENNDKQLGIQIWQWGKEILKSQIGSIDFYSLCARHLKLICAPLEEFRALWDRVMECGVDLNVELVSEIFSAFAIDKNEQRRFINQVISQPPSSSFDSDLLDGFIGHCVKTRDWEQAKAVWKWSSKSTTMTFSKNSNYILAFLQHLRNFQAPIEEFDILWEHVLRFGLFERVELVTAICSALSVDRNEQRRFIESVISRPPSSSFDSGLLDGFIGHCVKTHDWELAKAIWNWISNANSTTNTTIKIRNSYYFLEFLRHLKGIRAPVQELDLLWKQVLQSGFGERVELVTVMCSALAIDEREQRRFIESVISRPPSPSFDLVLLDEFLKHCSSTDKTANMELAKSIWNWGSRIRGEKSSSSSSSSVSSCRSVKYFQVHFRYLFIVGATKPNLEEYNGLWDQILECQLQESAELVTAMCSALAIIDQKAQCKFISNYIDSTRANPSFHCALLHAFLKPCLGASGNQRLAKAVWNWGKGIRERDCRSYYYFSASLQYFSSAVGAGAASVQELKDLWNQVRRYRFDGRADLVSDMCTALSIDPNEQRRFINQIISSNNNNDNNYETYTCTLLASLLSACININKNQQKNQYKQQNNENILASRIWAWSLGIRERERGTAHLAQATSQYLLACGATNAEQLKAIWTEAKHFHVTNGDNNGREVKKSFLRAALISVGAVDETLAIFDEIFDEIGEEEKGVAHDDDDDKSILGEVVCEEAFLKGSREREVVVRLLKRLQGARPSLLCNKLLLEAEKVTIKSNSSSSLLSTITTRKWTSPQQFNNNNDDVDKVDNINCNNNAFEGLIKGEKVYKSKSIATTTTSDDDEEVKLEIEGEKSISFHSASSSSAIDQATMLKIQNCISKWTTTLLSSKDGGGAGIIGSMSSSIKRNSASLQALAYAITIVKPKHQQQSSQKLQKHQNQKQKQQKLQKQQQQKQQEQIIVLRRASQLPTECHDIMRLLSGELRVKIRYWENDKIGSGNGSSPKLHIMSRGQCSCSAGY